MQSIAVMTVLLLSAIGQVVATHLASKPVMAAMLALRTVSPWHQLDLHVSNSSITVITAGGVRRESKQAETATPTLTALLVLLVLLVLLGLQIPPELALNSLPPLTVMLAFLQFGAMAQNAWTRGGERHGSTTTPPVRPHMAART
jgi:uncharacterized membrane protein YwaF